VEPAALIVLGAALGFAIATVLTKSLTGTETTFGILVWMNLIQLPLNLAGSEPLFPLKLGLGDLPAAIGVGSAASSPISASPTPTVTATPSQ
jgi:drug/metabolite transporter (DMT)-like permease